MQKWRKLWLTAVVLDANEMCIKIVLQYTVHSSCSHKSVTNICCIRFITYIDIFHILYTFWVSFALLPTVT